MSGAASLGDRRGGRIKTFVDHVEVDQKQGSGCVEWRDGSGVIRVFCAGSGGA